MRKSKMFSASATSDLIRQKNNELYDETSGRVWQLAVYDGLHDGWEFINLGGKQILRSMAARADLGPAKRVLELCCGQAATCRYLADTYGCEVTGVEMNPRQVEKARAHLSSAAPHVANRVEIVLDNVVDWRPRQLYDAVISIDSFVLIQ